MKWWKGERVIYEPDAQTGLQKVAAVQLGAPTPRPKKRPRHLTKKIGGIIMDDTPWAHCDIAGMVWAEKPGATWDKGATGYGVRLIDRFIRDTVES